MLRRSRSKNLFACSVVIKLSVQYDKAARADPAIHRTLRE